MSPRVLVADASPFVRLAVRSALAQGGIADVVEVATAAEALALTAADPPDAVLLDWHLDPELAVAARISDALGGGALIVLSPNVSGLAALMAVRAGACGFLPKDTPPERLPAIVRGVVAGEAAFPRHLVRSLLARVHQQPAAPSASVRLLARPLTSREQEVLDLMLQGFGDHLIGERLGVSPVTVRRHAGTARRKLRAAGRAEALEIYRRAVA